MGGEPRRREDDEDAEQVKLNDDCAKQQELARSQAGVKENRRVCVEVPASTLKAKTTSGENGLEFFVFGGALGEIYNHVEGHRNDSATILDLSLTSSTFDAIASQLFHKAVSRVDIVDKRTNTTVGAQTERPGKLVEPESKVTTVSKLVDLMATTFGGDLMDSLTNCKQESHLGNTAKETSKSESSFKVSRKMVFGIICSSTLLARQMNELVQEIENVEETHSTFGFVGDGQSRSKVPRKLFMVLNFRPHGERLSK